MNTIEYSIQIYESMSLGIDIFIRQLHDFQQKCLLSYEMSPVHMLYLFIPFHSSMMRVTLTETVDTKRKLVTVILPFDTIKSCTYTEWLNTHRYIAYRSWRIPNVVLMLCNERGHFKAEIRAGMCVYE